MFAALKASLLRAQPAGRTAPVIGPRRPLAPVALPRQLVLSMDWICGTPTVFWIAWMVGTCLCMTTGDDHIVNELHLRYFDRFLCALNLSLNWSLNRNEHVKTLVQGLHCKNLRTILGRLHRGHLPLLRNGVVHHFVTGLSLWSELQDFGDFLHHFRNMNINDS